MKILCKKTDNNGLKYYYDGFVKKKLDSRVVLKDNWYEAEILNDRKPYRKLFSKDDRIYYHQVIKVIDANNQVRLYNLYEDENFKERTSSSNNYRDFFYTPQEIRDIKLKQLIK